jgi:acyl-CoA reductase-like NAD-dependent aldehyde dehydrogenase
MDAIDEKLKRAKLEHGFYNIIDGKRVLAGKTLSVVNPATGMQLATVPDVDHTLLDEAVSAAQRAFSGWRAVPTSQRKVILASLVNRIDDHAEELSVLLTAEQGGPVAIARFYLDLLTKAMGPALMQMELPEIKQEVPYIGHIRR